MDVVGGEASNAENDVTAVQMKTKIYQRDTHEERNASKVATIET